MTLTPRMFLIVCPLLFLAGFVDSIAGGGGLISLPAYLLAGLPIPEAEAAAGDGFQDAMLVMCGLDEQRFDTFLKALRASALPRIPLKAVLTPYNALWSAVQLHAELRREHESMAGGGTK